MYTLDDLEALGQLHATCPNMLEESGLMPSSSELADLVTSEVDDLIYGSDEDGDGLRYNADMVSRIGEAFKIVVDQEVSRLIERADDLPRSSEDYDDGDADWYRDEQRSQSRETSQIDAMFESLRLRDV